MKMEHIVENTKVVKHKSTKILLIKTSSAYYDVPTQN